MLCSIGCEMVTHSPIFDECKLSLLVLFICIENHSYLLSDDNTRSKFLFYGGKDYLQSSGGLVDYIPHEFVPNFLGGPCKVSIFITIILHTYKIYTDEAYREL